MPDITPKYEIIAMKDKVVLPSVPENFGQFFGGLQANATSVQQGSGNNVYKVGEKGIHLGAAEFADAPFSVSMAGALHATSGTFSGDITGATGTFSGTVSGGQLNIGGLILTIDNTGSIQTSLDTINAAGGGTLYLKSGTYVQNTPLTGYSSVKIVGVSPSQTIINFNNTSANLTFAGSNVYNTGTVTVASGTAITGSGTTWTSAMAGRHLFLGTRWYQIASVTDATHLVLAESYGDTVTLPASYRIASVMTDFGVFGVTLKNSTGTALVITDARKIILDNVLLLTNNKGFVFTNMSEMNADRFNIIANTSNGGELTNVGLCDWESVNAAGNGGSGMVLNNVKTMSFLPCTGDGNTGDGFNITTGVDISMLVEASSNGGQGVECVSGCDNIEFFNCLVSGNTSDGIKLTASSDNCKIYGGKITGNGGYGINIAASTCDNNVITTNTFVSNVSGAVNDLGTGTVIRGNVGVNDNSINNLQVTRKAGTAADQTAIAVSSGAGTNTDVVITHTLGATPTLIRLSFIGDAASSVTRRNAIYSGSYGITGNLLAGIQISNDATGTAIPVFAASADYTLDGNGGDFERITLTVINVGATTFTIRINGQLPTGVNPGGSSNITSISWSAE